VAGRAEAARDRRAEIDPIALAVPLALSLLSYARWPARIRASPTSPGRHLPFTDWLRITFVSNTANYLVTSAGLSGFAVRMLLLSQHGVSSGRAVLISLVQTFLTNFTLLLFILAASWRSWCASTSAGSSSTGDGDGRRVRRAARLRVRPRRPARAPPAYAGAPDDHRAPHRAAIHAALDAEARPAPPLPRQLNQGFDFLLKRKERMIAPTAWILFDWVLTVGVLWAAFWAVNHPLPPSIVIMGFGVGLLFSLVSFIPGRPRRHGGLDGRPCS
jgi:uncharacterized membrane protein YbhN (UPF0104 family)